MAYWALTKTQAKSFLGRTSRFGTVEGPAEMYSFSSRPDRPFKPDPERAGKTDPLYFMAGQALKEAITGTVEGQMPLRETIRQGVALCEDWNAMTYLFILDVPAHLRMEVWFGLSKFQPRLSTAKTDCGILNGGWLQYLVDLDDASRKYLRGPIRTGW